MNRSVSRRVTGAVGAAAVLVLVLGGVGYLRTASNAERIDDRNLRELARTARTIEGTVNNLHTVLASLAGETEPDRLRSKAELIPHLTIDNLRLGADASCRGQRGRTATGTISAEQSLELCYNGNDDPIEGAIHARYPLAALEPYLASDYMDAVFLADSAGTVFAWAPDRTGVRVHSLAALDSVYLRSTNDVSRLGTSTIVRAPIAGRDYYFYLLPLRLDITRPDTANDQSRPITWILGGVISASEHRQESLSLHPPVALFLGFIAILGFLAVPIVRVYTMGPRERLRVGNLLYLVLALVLAAGLIGLGLGDLAHYRRLRADIYAELEATADSVAKNIDAELAYALDALDGYGEALRQRVREATNALGEDAFPQAGDSGVAPLAMLFDITRSVLDTIRMRVRIDADTLDREHRPATVYPELHMVFWADSAGQQVAKWTARDHNTPRVDVADREYHRAIRDRRGWPRLARASSGNACSDDADVRADALPQRSTYHIESIRSWTTGEKLAAISTRFPRQAAAGGDPHPWGVGVIITELASLRHAVLPAGVNIAVVDSEAVTQFHTRPERMLEENFAEETDQADLVRSVLHARACRALDLEYGGRRTRLVIRPLRGRPLFLMTFMDRALLDTVEFEAWFVAAAIFGALAFFLFLVVAFLDRAAHMRLAWIWPHVERPGTYVALVAIAAPFLIASTVQALWPSTFPTSPATFLAPVVFMGLGLVPLSTRDNARGGSGEASFGWGLFALAATVLVALAWAWRPLPALEIGSAGIALLLTSAWSTRAEVRERADGWTDRHNLTRQLYTAAMTVGLLVVGVLPGYLAYQVAFLDRSELLFEHHQLEVADALKARSARLESVIRERVSTAPAETVLRDALRPPFDLAFAGIVGVDTVTQTNAPPTMAPRRARTRDWPRPLVRLLGDRVPFLTVAAVYMRQLSEPRAGRISTREHDRLQLRESEASMLVSTLPPAAGRRWWLLGLVGAFAIIALIVHRVSRRVLFVHVEHAAPLTLDDALPETGDGWRSTIFVGTRSVSRKPIRKRGDVQVIDMMSPRTLSGDDSKPVLDVEKDKNVICLDHFDYRFTEPNWNRQLLAFFEQHIYSDRPRRFILITSRDPDALLGTREPDDRPSQDDARLSQDDKRRWDRLLGQFAKVIVTDRVSPNEFEMEVGKKLPADPRKKRNAERVRRTLVDECGRSERLQEVGRQILARPDWPELERDEVVDLIREGGETYYGARWAILTEEERLVVAQLASGAVVNPRSRQAVTRLFARGFVVRGPEPRLDNESFTRFVQDKVPSDRLTRLERADSPSTWSLVRAPLILGWIGVALFLFWTQRDVLGNTIAFLSTAGVGLGAIVRVLTLFERGTGAQEPAPRS